MHRSEQLLFQPDAHLGLLKPTSPNKDSHCTALRLLFEVVIIFLINWLLVWSVKFQKMSCLVHNPRYQEIFMSKKLELEILFLETLLKLIKRLSN